MPAECLAHSIHFSLLKKASFACKRYTEYSAYNQRMVKSTRITKYQKNPLPVVIPGAYLNITHGHNNDANSLQLFVKTNLCLPKQLREHSPAGKGHPGLRIHLA